MRKLSAIISLFLVSVVWGATFPLVKGSLDFITPLGFIALRFLLAFALLSIFFAKSLKGNKELLFPGFVLGLFLFLGYFFQTVGLKYTSSSHSGFITGLYVVFTPIFAVLMIKEKLSLKVIIAVFLSLIGLYLLSNMSGGMNFGDFLTLLCAISYAIQVVLVAKYSRMYNPTSLTIIELAFVFLLSTGGWAWEGFYYQMNSFMLFGVIFTGVFATALAILAQTHAQRVIPSSHAAVIYTTEPVFAGIFSYLLLGETLGTNGIIGAALILFGMLLVALDKSGS
ncbi:EamA family transporter [Euryarchaeota archaeon ex4484_178]|nr:MAG: EamA family transporter [Euryarchaeota archaeon ex4484_178]